MTKKTANDVVLKQLNPFSQLDSIKEIWTSMLEKCPHNYSQSWGWIEVWLKNLTPDCNLSLIVGCKNETPVVTFFLGSASTTRHRFFKFHQLSLNSTCIRYIDNSTHIEYNTMLIDPEITIPLNSLLRLIPVKWDEFHMPRCIPDLQSALIMDGPVSGEYTVSTMKSKSYYVDLEKVRHHDNDYLALLSQNRRKQIRRSLKEYEKIGEIRVDIADDAESALKILDELIVLHQKTWIDRGQPGSFSHQYMVNFYKKLIIERFHHGEIQLMKISAGNYTVGCLYNFIYNGKVMALLGGLSYLPENYYLPGFVCDYYAVLHNAEAGFYSYDLMEGDFQQKKSLATDYNELQDIFIIRNTLKHQFEKSALIFHRAYKRMLHH